MNTTPKVHNPDNLTPEEYGAAEGWRLLYEGEAIARDAEYTCNREWRVSGCCGCTICPGDFTYRTRTPDPYAPKAAADKAPDSGWIKMSERKPTEADLPIWAHVAGNNNHFDVLLIRDTSHMVLWAIAHWMPAKDIPAPPSRELTQEEKDMAAFVEWINGDGDERTSPGGSWHAAIVYERAEIARLVADYRNSAELPGDLIQKLEARVKGTQ